MISQDQWINLPIGYNLDDHVGVRVGIADLGCTDVSAD